MSAAIVALLGGALGCTREESPAEPVAPLGTAPAPQAAGNPPPPPGSPQPTASGPPALAALPEPRPSPPPTPPPGPTPEKLAELEAAVAANPEDGFARRELAMALFAALRRDDAVEQFEQIVEIDPSPGNLLALANAYGYVARNRDAEATYRKVLQQVPDHPITLYNLGSLAMVEARRDEAREFFRRAVQAKPDYLLAQYQLGYVLNLAGEYREAYLTYAKVLDLDPTSAEELEAFDNALYDMATIDIKMGAVERAEEMLRTLLETNPEHPSAHYAYGQLLLRMGRLEDAQREIAEHMRLRAESKPSGQVATGN